MDGLAIAKRDDRLVHGFSTLKFACKIFCLCRSNSKRNCR
jgi:hypothetical protein